MGKTKKFSAERFLAICDFLIALNADGSREHKNWNRSVDYLACVSNQFSYNFFRLTHWLKKAS